jgi:hypothetical protein
MSTPPDLAAVKRALLEKLHEQVVPALAQLLDALPGAFTDAAQAERQLRAGFLAADPSS